jgi:MFS family permease
MNRPGRQGLLSLMRTRRFAPFFWVQFLGALNDNIFKVGFSSLVTYHAAQFGGLEPSSAAFLISAAFVLPFIPFSATAGQLADKLDKARVTRIVKNCEIGIMLAVTAGLLLHSAPLLLVCTLLMGLHSAVFGPVKYAYLPQHLHETELMAGNGLFEMGTFVAILFGTITGGALAAAGAHGPLLIGVLTLVFALAGRACASAVPAAPPSAPELRLNWNPLGETLANLRVAGADRTVFAALLGISWLWYVGATFLASFFAFARDALGADAGAVTVLLAAFSLGVGTGSLACARLSGDHVEPGLVPLGLAGMTLFGVDLYFASHAFAPVPGHALVTAAQFLGRGAAWRVLADLFLLSAAGGLYSVPLYALIQARSAPTHRARIIAANNILNSLFMVISALVAALAARLGLSIPGLYLATACVNAMAAVALCKGEPLFAQRCVVWLRQRAPRRPI